MKSIKNKALLVICVFVLMTMLASIVLAGKPNPPPPPRPSSEKYGYAMLEIGNMITDDGNGQYIDIEKVTVSNTIYWENGIKRGDKIRVVTYDDSPYELAWLRAFIGKPELPYRSPRRANFNFSLKDDAATPRPGDGMAVYDILSNETANGPLRNLAGTVHFVVAYKGCDFFSEGNQTRAMFMIDPGCLATDPLAISQTTVNSFYTGDVDLSYWTSIQGADTTPGDSDAHDQIAYHLLVDQLDITPFDTDGDKDKKPDTWVIEPKQMATTLKVYKDIGRRNRPNYVAVPLATYESITFKITLSLIPFTTPAPPKNSTISTTWGDIKNK